MQTTHTVLMIRPASFSFNPDTAANNRFQHQARADENVQRLALEEFDAYVTALRAQDVEVLVHNDRALPHTPDSIFPNNCWSSHPDGTLVIYPMQGENRRLERHKGVLDWLREHHQVERLVDFSDLERQGLYLEGTGSMVFDREQRICYAGYSTRTHARALRQVVDQLGYQLCGFHAVDRGGVPIYHTNVMMSVGRRLALICLRALADEAEREGLRQRLETSGKELLTLDWEQLESFAGNMLEVHNRRGEPLLVMSRTAWRSLDAGQRRQIERHATPLPVNIDTIERIGGGSARCMLAEVFLARRQFAVECAR
ncbi:citrulline utilization hydrolase CtlX [Pseudomonas gingeri]|uniref:Amidinotransferase n=1 Tax=Pseudomonas gingeri TaxID=117681 RepID=A0A7Y8CKX6_9PSED|nr:arginine deiminase-related protein [Pseudomonas gingeri]NWB29181.1 amidinotransferase [Pseudomonas gingeri]NWC34506.1 amidinotransferase [Pseudomonas gingeri]NWD06683.1 amidinotransferase [Pseudomonas gingeri]NWD49291.1 amidinotransferase [Pseudomonas gingeri]NWE24976.1 amidinotransferase [Pseudomonas gingeri]